MKITIEKIIRELNEAIRLTELDDVIIKRVLSNNLLQQFEFKVGDYAVYDIDGEIEYMKISRINIEDDGIIYN